MAVTAESLVQAAGDAGSADLALEALYERYGERLERLCRRHLGPGGDAEDAAHETILKAWSARDRFDVARPMWPWLATIARNTCTDLQRRHQLAAVRHPLPDVGPGDPQEVVAALDQAHVVRRALGRLSGDDRDVLVLRDIEGWGYPDIAARQGRSAGAVRMAVARARGQLRSHVEDLARASGQWPLAAFTGGIWARVRMRAGHANAWRRGFVVDISRWCDVTTSAGMVALAPLALTGMLALGDPGPSQATDATVPSAAVTAVHEVSSTHDRWRAWSPARGPEVSDGAEIDPEPLVPDVPALAAPSPPALVLPVPIPVAPPEAELPSLELPPSLPSVPVPV